MSQVPQPSAVKPLEGQMGIVEELNKKEKYYFTFMQKHTSLKDKYIVFEGTFISTRKAMSRRYGDQWAFQYSEAEWRMPNGKTQAEEFGLEEIKV